MLHASQGNMAVMRLASRILVLAVGVVASCEWRTDEPDVLELLAFGRPGEDTVALNDTLVFSFSDDLDRVSVTSSSVVIRDSAGRAARGVLSVDHEKLKFTPELPRNADLEDGGLRPGETYTVVLGGFPRLDGIRSEAGAPLAETYQLTFRTATVGGAVPIFHPDDSGDLLRLASRSIGPLEPIVLMVGDAIDPRSLVVGEFEILRQGGDVARDVLRLRPTLVENGPTGAVVELVPESGAGSGKLRALEPGTYHLRRASATMATLSGRVLEFPLRLTGGRLVTIEVRRRTQSKHITFETTARRHYGEVSDAEANAVVRGGRIDGTAHWDVGAAAVTLRFPAAAGDGSDGAIAALTELDDATDVQATELVVPQGKELDLSSHHGFVTLRSQGRLEVKGTLRRELGADPSDWLSKELREHADAGTTWGTLSAWLERARKLNEPWTVLIAGGDLRVTGRIEVEGPLMLVAGGWIRVYGRVSAPKAQLFKSGPGGENVSFAHDLPLALDPPATNPLATLLRVAVRTNPIRPLAGVERWEGASAEILEGGGAAYVQYLGICDRSGTSATDEFSAVEDVRVLENCDAVSLLLVVEMPPEIGAPWDPPKITSVDLEWREPVSPRAAYEQR